MWQSEDRFSHDAALVMRKPAFCICKNKDADQLYGNREADQHLCFRYIASTIPLFPKPLAIFCDCTARFVSDQIRNPEDLFSHNKAHYLLEPANTCHYETNQPSYTASSNYN